MTPASRISKAQGRAVKEWIGATPDAKVPPRVRLRIFEREGGICHISKRKIMPGERWDLDHVPALINGGQNRESMLFPALKDKHKAKTKEDVAEKAAVAAKAKAHLSIKRESPRPLQSRGFAPGKIREPKAPAQGLTNIQRRFGVSHDA